LFEKLKQAFSSVATAVKERTLSDKELDEILQDFQLTLLESDVAVDVAASLAEGVKQGLSGTRIERSGDVDEIVKAKLSEALDKTFSAAGTADIVANIRKKNEGGEPYCILFLGINGTGKTTSIAKFTDFLKRAGVTVVCVAGDTHRPGAIEQLSEHAERLSVKVISQRYGADPAAVGRDGILYARSHHVDAVLVDTAGRMQTNQNLMDEMAKIIRVVKPDFKIFVADSLTGNDAVSQAELFDKYTGFDGVILTKSDADSRGGAAISITHSTGKPILFLGVGQGYSDLVPFDYHKFVGSLLG
jgi:fused signal recognition particle receptor